MKSAILLLALAGVDAVMRSQTSVGVRKTGLRQRFLADARRLGAALRQSSPAEAAAAYRRLRSANSNAARALHGAHGLGFVLMPVPVLATAPALDDALEDVGEDLQAITQNFGTLDHGAFDESFFAQPMSFAVQGPEFEPFDTFGALRNVTGWTHSSEFSSANGTSLERVCESGSCTEFKRVCQGGTCTETARPVPATALHAKPALSVKRSPLSSETGGLGDARRKQLEPRHLDFDRLFNHGIFDDSMDWPEMSRAPLLHFPQHNESGHSASGSVSESTETRMENGELYKKVCRNGNCTETTRKCANWSCADSM